MLHMYDIPYLLLPKSFTNLFFSIVKVDDQVKMLMSDMKIICKC